MDLGLAGKCALVTGGSRGIGRAIASGLAAEGARVAIVARGEADVSEALRAIREQGGTALGVVGDVATEAGAASAFERALDGLGGLDILVNNAGGSLGAGTFDRVDAALWTRVLDLNLTSLVAMSRLAVAPMQERAGGVILHIGSVCGREYCTSAPYVAAKAAVTGLTKEMAVDLAKLGIRVACIAPGSILFPGGSWDRRHRENPDLIARMLRDDLPWGRFGAADEVANVAVFLASPRASWVSGSTVVVDGAQGRAF